MDNFKKLLVKYKTSPSEVGKFCLKNKAFCKEHKNFICKSILKTAGYKIDDEKFSNAYCTIFKELSDILETKLSHGDEYMRIRQNINEYTYKFNKSSKMLQDFLIFNNIPIKPLTNHMKFRSSVSSKATEKMSRVSLVSLRPSTSSKATEKIRRKSLVSLRPTTTRQTNMRKNGSRDMLKKILDNETSI